MGLGSGLENVLQVRNICRGVAPTCLENISISGTMSGVTPGLSFWFSLVQEGDMALNKGQAGSLTARTFNRGRHAYVVLMCHSEQPQENPMRGGILQALDPLQLTQGREVDLRWRLNELIVRSFLCTLQPVTMSCRVDEIHDGGNDELQVQL